MKKLSIMLSFVVLSVVSFGDKAFALPQLDIHNCQQLVNRTYQYYDAWSQAPTYSDYDSSVLAHISVMDSSGCANYMNSEMIQDFRAMSSVIHQYRIDAFNHHAAQESYQSAQDLMNQSMYNIMESITNPSTIWSP